MSTGDLDAGWSREDNWGHLPHSILRERTRCPPGPPTPPSKTATNLLLGGGGILTVAVLTGTLAAGKAKNFGDPFVLATVVFLVVGSLLLIGGLYKRMGKLGAVLGSVGALVISGVCMGMLISKVNTTMANAKPKPKQPSFAEVCDDASSKDASAPKYDQAKSGKHPTVFYFGTKGSWVRSGDAAFERHAPDELSADEIELVACVSEQPLSVEVCQYTTDSFSTKPDASLTRTRLDLSVRLVSLRTGKDVVDARVE